MTTTARVTPALTWEQREHLIDLVVDCGGGDMDAFQEVLKYTRQLVEGEVSS